MSPPRFAAALGLAAALALSACGKTDLVRTGTGTAAATPLLPAAPRRAGPGAPAPNHSASPAPSGAKPPPAIGETAVPLPLPLSGARAARFARAVQLTAADVVGASTQPRSSSPRIDEEEAARCTGGSGGVVGGGRSLEYVRGKGLEREDFSSSVEVLTDAARVSNDLAYTQSRAGIRCYTRIVRQSAGREGSEHVRLLGVSVSPFTVDVPGGQRAAGLRIVARVGIPGSSAEVALFSDALSLGYGPAELDLYATSFVQPAPQVTEQQLLTLMRERARRAQL